MSDIAIHVENLGKLYHIGQQQKYRTLRETLVEGLKSPIRRLCTQKSIDEANSIIWALKDVSFDVKRGEVIGIIGRNGAGKSTLLKIASRITEPTEGCISIRGRVGSLLEVGTGFHQELTGRENIFLNGAILGMKRAEIKRKFDEIVAFSEIEKFLDTPVKHYSSGMYVRLAFAVAAHLEPEVLVVDEVLAVGDASFQKKCLGKMGMVAKEGRTVLFVSHNMPAITRLCPRVIMLDHGKLIEDGESSAVASHYQHADKGSMVVQEWPELRDAPGDDKVRLRAARVLYEGKQCDGPIDIRKSFKIRMEYQVIQPNTVLRPWLTLWNDEGTCLFNTTETNLDSLKQPKAAGHHFSEVTIPGNLLAEGGVSATVGIAAVGDFYSHFIVNDAVVFQVVDSFEGDSARGQYGGPMPGVTRPKLNWSSMVVGHE